MQSSNILFSSLLVQAPALLVYLVGIVLAVVNLNRYRKISAMTLIAMIMSLAAVIVFSMVTAWLQTSAFRRGITSGQLLQYYMVVSLARSVVHSVAIGILLAAVFMMRGEWNPGFPVQPTGGQFAPPPPIPGRYDR